MALAPGVHKVKVFVVEVEGSGEFPFDMLRYDSCVPATGEDAGKLHHYHDELRRVRLLMHEVGRGGPTVGRWQSFGWKVVGYGGEVR